jgi:hypothetical protein
MKIKTFDEFCLNETADMMFMPVDPIKSAGKMYETFYEEMKAGIKKFIENLKNEGRETKEAFRLVVKASKGEIELSKEQRSSIYQQLGDIFKTLGLAALTVVPGDMIIFMLIKFLKAEKYVFPSSFLT